GDGSCARRRSREGRTPSRRCNLRCRSEAGENRDGACGEATEPGTRLVGSTRVSVPKRHFHSCRWQEHRRSHLLSQGNGCHPVRQALTSLELECPQLVSIG